MQVQEIPKNVVTGIEWNEIGLLGALAEELSEEKKAAPAPKKGS